MADQHRNSALCEDLDRLAAENKRRHTFPTVRGHHDQVAVSLLCGIDDGFVRMLLLDVNDFKGMPALLAASVTAPSAFPGIAPTPSAYASSAPATMLGSNQ
jgi:hypothetical protein